MLTPTRLEAAQWIAQKMVCKNASKAGWSPKEKLWFLKEKRECPKENLDLLKESFDFQRKNLDILRKSLDFLRKA